MPARQARCRIQPAHERLPRPIGSPLARYRRRAVALVRHRPRLTVECRAPKADRIDWARTHAVRLMHAGLPGRHLGRRQPGRRDRGAASPIRAHVRHHRFLPPLLLAQDLQDLARRAVHVRRAGRLGRAARPDLVGGPSPPPPREFRPSRRHALADSSTASGARTWAGSCPARASRPTSDACATCMQFRELRWLDRFDIARAGVAGPGHVPLGVLLENAAPDLGTNGWQMLVWGFFVSTVVCYARHLHHQLAVACLRQAALRHRRHQPQQLAAGAHHAGRGLAQQPPPLPAARRARASTGGKSTSPTTCSS